MWNPAAASVLWIMLNPSTADANLDDPTIRRCIGFSRGWGYGGIVVCNLFALRSTDPAVLNSHPSPIGSDNDRWILTSLMGGPVIAGWGKLHKKLVYRSPIVVRMLIERNYAVYCLGTNKDGSPKHPLYLAENTAIRVFANAPGGAA